MDLVKFQLDIVLQSGAILNTNWHMIQAHNLMNFDSLLVVLKLQYARPLKTLEKPYKILDILVTTRYLYEARNLIHLPIFII